MIGEDLDLRIVLHSTAVAFAADGWWLNLGRPSPRQGVACGGLAQCSPADGWLD